MTDRLSAEDEATICALRGCQAANVVPALREVQDELETTREALRRLVAAIDSRSPARIGTAVLIAQGALLGSARQMLNEADE